VARRLIEVPDTIVAIATPPGRGGLGVVRMSGSLSSKIAARLASGTGALKPRHATFTRLAHEGMAIDHVVVTFFPGPGSYTGEDVVEISAHGNPVILRAIVRAAMAHGARLADPGEFTLRAFLNGRLDLVQAEAVADLVQAATPLQSRVAFDQLEGTLTTRIGEIDRALFGLSARLEASLDFPEEGYQFIDSAEAVDHISRIQQMVGSLAEEGARGRLLREGITVAIVGRPNVGKSSLFNALAGADRAIVTEVPGTTRDLITEVVDVNGAAVTLVDTAGLRESVDAIEAEGVRRARHSAETAQVAVVVLDGSEPLRPDDHELVARTRTSARVVVRNKSDLAGAWRLEELRDTVAPVSVSATTGAGLEDLRAAIVESLGAGDLREGAAITNIRHLALLDRAAAALARAREAASISEPEELVLADLHEARSALEEITGKRSSDDLLNEIFSRFCIGK
jgi:tRNA modification GTPase